jgi:hypothetical protein
MFFYDPMTRKHFCEIDEDRINIVAWAEKGLIIHFRVTTMGQTRKLLDSLPSNFSKIVYDPERGEAWIQN